MKYIKGNLLRAETDALVNTVNTVGVMGKGIALQFKKLFPQNYLAYRKACKEGNVLVGKMYVYKEANLEGEKIIINFPTKKHWRQKSQYTFIEQGLKNLAQVIEDQNIKSLSIPPLGCGNGGLDWEIVKSLIEKYLGHLSTEIYVFEPNTEIKKILQKENKPKKIQLTPARAMLLFAMFKYERLGEYSSVFVANKLAYFLQESGEKLRLKFVPYTYGPYAQAVEKVLYALNGKYLTGMEQMNTKPFEVIQLNYDRYQEVADFIENKLSPEQKTRLTNLFKIIDGFESNLSLEVLSSVHYLHRQNPEIKEPAILEKIQLWNKRKKVLITKQYVQIANQHLQVYQQLLST